jgi:hypothetical protein
MPFPTRDALITAGKIRTITIQTREVGDMRLAEPSDAATSRIRALYNRQSKGEDVESALRAELLMALCVDHAGLQMFKTAEEAQQAREAMTEETLALVVSGFAELKGAKERPPGNSEASQSDTSLSASASP